MRVRATEMAEKVYKRFLEQVVNTKIVLDRCTSQDEHGRELSEKEQQQVAEGKMHDPRRVRLMCISGKGGGRTLEEVEKFSKYYNVTLLDHLLSVTRGSLMLASLDWLTRNPEMAEDFLMRKLYIIAVVAFMHDIDKDLRKPGRIKDAQGLTDLEVAERMQRYGLTKFLETLGITLTPDQLLYLIDKVESQQANRCLPDQMPPHYMDDTLPLYVRLADKLDGQWLENGMEGVIDWLNRDRSCLRSEYLIKLLSNLSDAVIELFDPHHPFLMDELQRKLAQFSRRLAGVPPLIEIHHDGRLVMLILAPNEQLKEIKKQAIESLCRALPFALKLFVSKRGESYLLNARPTHHELQNFLQREPLGELLPLFWIKASDKKLLKEPLTDLLDEIGLSPQFEDTSKSTGNIKLYASENNLTDPAKERLRKAAHAVLLLNLLLETKPKDGIPSYDEREEALVACIPEPRPTWISCLKEGHPRRVVTALWATRVACDNPKVDKAIWADLLKQWLEGNEGQKGFNQFIEAAGPKIAQAVAHHFEQLLSGQRLVVEDESLSYHCLFTDQPCDNLLKDNMGLGKVGIKVSAFSSRDGRPEPLDLAEGFTYLSPIAIAEHTFRAKVHQERSKKDLSTPTLIYSPTTLGLFGGLAMGGDDKSMNTLSLQELSRFEVKSSSIKGLELYNGRYRITRLESIPGKMEEQVSQLHDLLKATVRIGRPLHVFRGLPTPQRAFFYYDAMPTLLAELLQEEGQGESRGALRLEQIHSAIHRLDTAKLLLETWGYGYQVLQLYAYRTTRFKGICLAWEGLREKSRLLSSRLEFEYHCYIKGQHMQEEDGVMVKLGREAAKIQSYPKDGFRASNHEQSMVLNICLDSLEQMMKIPVPQTDRNSLINGITDQLMQTLDRRNLIAASGHRDSKPLYEACLNVASMFVEDFWIAVMNRHFPSQGNLRILKSIYRMSFMLQRKKLEDAEEHPAP